MNLFNKAKEFTQNVLEDQKNKVIDKIEQKKEDMEYISKMKSEFKDTQKYRKGIFLRTQKLGHIEIDEKNKLIKINNASSDTNNKMGLMGKATLAYFTVGISLLVELAMKPQDVIFSYDEILDVSLYKNTKEVKKSKKSDILATGLILALANTAIISDTSTSHTVIKNLFLEIDTSLKLFPVVMVPFINKETKIGSRSYNKAISTLKETAACFDLIFNERVEPKKEKKKSLNKDSYNELIKLKDLLDKGIISEEEFNLKKKEILNL